MAYALLSLWIVPFGIVLVARTIPRQLRAVRAAAGRDEKMYWMLNAVGCMFAAFGSIATGLAMIDDVRGGSWGLAAWWPSISRLWCHSGDRAILLLLDLLTSFGGALAAMCAARCFGYVDEDDVWRKSDWRMGRRAADPHAHLGLFQPTEPVE